jgi:hypothetical protein
MFHVDKILNIFQGKMPAVFSKNQFSNYEKQLKNILILFLLPKIKVSFPFHINKNAGYLLLADS